jgi:release factor glutamine methyltransferase
MTTSKSPPTTVGIFLAWAIKSLSETNIPTARLDSLILMEDVLGQDRAHLLTYPELLVNSTQVHRLEKLIKLRQQHIPLAYIRSTVMFYRRSFYVTRDTLIPRPESEDMITLLKSCLQNNNELAIADIGTGSGCLGLTAALEIESRLVDLYDIDAKALAVARANAKSLEVSAVHFFHENLLSRALHRRYDVILANLPYVPVDFPINQDAKFEPKLALFAGADGLDDYRAFWDQIEKFASKPQYVLTESQPGEQHRSLVALAEKVGYKSKEELGFIQLFSLI